jgi:hypothetical protein
LARIGRHHGSTSGMQGEQAPGQSSLREVYHGRAADLPGRIAMGKTGNASALLVSVLALTATCQLWAQDIAELDPAQVGLG